MGCQTSKITKLHYDKLGFSYRKKSDDKELEELEELLVKFARCRRARRSTTSGSSQAVSNIVTSTKLFLNTKRSASGQIKDSFK
jgi:hypothetical protein